MDDFKIFYRNAWAGYSSTRDFAAAIQYQFLGWARDGAKLRWRVGVVAKGNWQGSNARDVALWNTGMAGVETMPLMEYAGSFNNKFGAWQNEFILPYGQSHPFNVHAKIGGTDSYCRSTDVGLVAGGNYYTLPQRTSPIENVAAQRSGSSVTVSWGASGSDAVIIERRDDGGSWRTVAEVAGAATSFSDSPARGISVEYRVCAFKSESGFSEASQPTAPIRTAPAAPASIEAESTQQGTINMVLKGTHDGVDGVVVEWSSNGSSWAPCQLSTQDYVNVTVIPSYRVALYRAAWTDGGVVGDYAYTDGYVRPLSKPAPPRIYMPSGVQSLAEPGITVAWEHSATDGTGQTAYKVAMGGHVQELNSSIMTTSFPNNFTSEAFGLQISVQTKGKLDEWSDASYATFDLVNPPSFSVRLFSRGAAVEDVVMSMPLDYQIVGVGNFNRALIEIAKGGDVVYSETSQSPNGSISATEFMPENGEDYEMRFTVYNTYGLRASSSIALSVDFLPPVDGVVSTMVDSDGGTVSLVVQDGVNDSGIQLSTLDQYYDPSAGSWTTRGGFWTEYALIEEAREYHITNGATGTAHAFRFADRPSPGDDPLELMFSMEPGAEVHALSGWVAFFVDNSGEGIEMAPPKISVTREGAVRPEAVSYDVIRVSNGKAVVLAEGMPAGWSMIDKYPPLNIEYSYRLVSHADSGSVSYRDFAENVESPYWFFHGSEVARAIWNPSGSWSVDRPERTLEWPDGRALPVVSDGSACERTWSQSFTVLDKATADALSRIVKAGGVGVFRSCDGEVMHAAMSVSASADYAKRGIYGGVTVSMTETDGDAV